MFYLVFLAFDEQLGCGDAGLVRRDLNLEKKEQQHHTFSECLHKHPQTQFFPFSDNTTIQFQGTNSSAAMWLLITAKTWGRMSSDQPAPQDKSHNSDATGVILVSNNHTSNSYITFAQYFSVNTGIASLGKFRFTFWLNSP